MALQGITGQTRSERGKGPMRRLRQDGIVPAVIYGKSESMSISLSAKELDSLLQKSRNQLISLSLENEGKKGKEQLVLIKEVQRHPLRPGLLHVDFLEVSMDKKQRLKVPANFVGTAKGVKLGGIVNYLRRELEIECLPADIPEEIKVNIADLDVGQSIHVKELKLTEGIKILNNPMDVLVTIVKVEEEKAATPAEGVEGEVGQAPAKEETKEEKDKGKEGKDS